MTREQVLTLLVDSLAKMPSKRPLRVSIDGRKGAGKTHLGDELADRLEAKGRACHRASLDDFHPPGYHQRLERGGFTPESYLQEGHDYASVRALLLDPVGPGGDRRCRLDCWNAHDDEPFAEDWVEMEQDAILLVDGVFLLTPALRNLWDYSIWLDVDWEVMQRRAAHRDEAGADGGQGALAHDTAGWMARHTLYEQTVRPYEVVDVVVDNSDIQHPYVVRLRPSARRGFKD